MRQITLAAILLAIVICLYDCKCRAAVLDWNRNPESDIAGYRVFQLGSPNILLADVSATTATVDVPIGAQVAVLAYDTVGLVSPLSAPVTVMAPVPSLDRSKWAVHSFSTQETVRENTPATNSIDGDSATIWHTNWDSIAPHYVAFSVPRSTVSRLDYAPRPPANLNGNFTAYEIESSDDGVTWQPWASGTWANDSTVKSASLPLRSIKYFRVWNPAGQWASAAEFYLKGTEDPLPPATGRAISQVSTNLTDWSDLSDDLLPAAPRLFFRFAFTDAAGRPMKWTYTLEHEP